MKKRMMAWILVMLLLAGSFTSCSNEGENADVQNTPAVEELSADKTEEAEVETEPETAYIDTLPNTDFGGRVFKMGCPTAYNMEPEELTGEVLNDAVFEQLLNTEEKFNVEIQRVDVSNAAVQAAVQANDDSFHIVTSGTSGGAAGYVLTGFVHNMYKFEDIDFTRPGWNQHTVEELTLNGKLYMAFGDIFAERGITYNHSFFFNKVLFDKFDINTIIKDNYSESNIYDLVRSGKWTFDAMLKMIDGIYVDTNGDGIAGFEDTYGLGQSIPVSGVYRTAFDCEIMTRDAEGWPVLNINTEKFIDIHSRVFDLCFNNPSVRMGEHAEESLLGKTFVAGQLALYSGFLCDVNVLREMEDEFGVIPFPKYDELQKDYLTTARGDNYFLSIPMNVKEGDFEFVGLVTESLAYYGNTLVRPAVYDETLKGKMTRDEDSIEMLDILTKGIIIEYAFAHANNVSFSYVLWNLLDAEISDFASYYQKKEKGALKYYDRLIESYKELGN